MSIFGIRFIILYYTLLWSHEKQLQDRRRRVLYLYYMFTVMLRALMMLLCGCGVGVSFHSVNLIHSRLAMISVIGVYVASVYVGCVRACDLYAYAYVFGCSDELLFILDSNFADPFVTPKPIFLLINYSRVQIRATTFARFCFRRGSQNCSVPGAPALRFGGPHTHFSLVTVNRHS